MDENRMNETMRGRGGGMGGGGAGRGGGMGRGGGGAGRGGGMGRGGGGRGGGGRGGEGRGGEGAALGAGGACVCPKCGARSAHRAGVPCMEERCPGCGCALVREGSPHHQQLLQRQREQNRTDADG